MTGPMPRSEEIWTVRQQARADGELTDHHPRTLPQPETEESGRLAAGVLRAMGLEILNVRDHPEPR